MSLGTKIYTWLKGNLVGKDELENKYYCNSKDFKDLKAKFSFSDYQKSERDFAFIVNKEVKAQDLIDTISNVDKSLIKDVKVFDVYEGDGVAENEKSLAIGLTFRDQSRTLTDEEINESLSPVIESLGEKLGATLRH